MDNDLVENEVIEIMKKVVDVPSGVNSDFLINNIYGWDSLSVIKFIVALDSEVGVKLNLDYFTVDRKILDIVQLIRNR
jgi:acyl carrier protein